jgi:3-hydroxyacyl-[acyl-carrier-protein] dehydratase
MDRNEYYLNIDEIKKFLPHRNPMLMVDKVLEIHPTGDIDDLLACDKVGTRVVAIKCVTQNESFFQGHYPKFSIMPGCLMLETMAQTAAFSLYPAISRVTARGFKFKHPVAAGYDNARFRVPVVPGDVLRIETVVTKCRRDLWVFKGQITVDGKLVAECEILGSGIHGIGPESNAGEV